jgi:hypothetical protein
VIPQPQIVQLAVDPASWKLSRSYTVTSLGFVLTVAAGFVYDLATVPRLLWWLIAPFELSCAAALIHDWLYQHGGLTGMQRFTRLQADRFLYDLAAQEGVFWWRRWLAYRPVRLFGARYWST